MHTYAHFPHSVLLVEDDSYLSQAYRYFLEQSGYIVLTAMDGESALKTISLKKPDLVLLDLVMPVMNGFEVLEEIKGSSVFRHIPVIVISNLGQESEIRMCKKLGATDYLIKSNFSMKEVIHKIQHHLDTFLD